MKKTAQKIIAAVFMLASLALLFWPLRRAADSIRFFAVKTPEKEAVLKAEEVFFAVNSLPAGYRFLSPEEKKKTHFRNLKSLDKHWESDKVDKNAVYALWKNGEPLLLSGEAGGALLKNRLIRQIILLNVRGGGKQFYRYIDQIHYHLFGLKTKRGYLIKLAPDEGAVAIKDKWKNVKAYLRAISRKPEVSYILFSEKNKTIFQAPKDLPRQAAEVIVTGDSLFFFGDIIEVVRADEKGNFYLRIGFFKPLLGGRIKNPFFFWLLSAFSFISAFLLMLFALRLWRGKADTDEKSELLNLIAENSGIIVAVFNGNGEIIYANAEMKKHFGGDFKVIAKRLEERITELGEKIKSGAEFNFYLIHSNELTWSVGGRALSEKNGEKRYLLAGFNISGEETEKRQKQLEERLKAMNILASGIAHEVRNPLNAISMIFQRLKNEYPPEKPDEEYFALANTLAKEISRLDMLINHFLSLTRPLKVKLEKFELKELMEELLLVIEAEIKEKNIRIEYEMDPEHIVIYSDRDLIKQALINFIRNAADALKGRENGLIRLFASRDDKGVTIGVSDNGSGMDFKQKEEILNPFYTTKSDGTGLGLSIVQKIVTQLGGTLQINSVKNIGSEFAIRFENEDKHPDR